MPMTLNEVYFKYVEKSSGEFLANIKEGSTERIESLKKSYVEFKEKANSVLATKTKQTKTIEEEVVLA